MRSTSEGLGIPVYHTHFSTTGEGHSGVCSLKTVTISIGDARFVHR